ncbi:hypothetical protein [Mesorhizobium sp. 43Arga]
MTGSLLAQVRYLPLTVCFGRFAGGVVGVTLAKVAAFVVVMLVVGRRVIP